MSTCTINYRLRLIEIDKLQGIPCHYDCIETETDGMYENKLWK